MKGWHGGKGSGRRRENQQNIDLSLCGSWEALVACKLLPQGVGTISTLGNTFMEKHVCRAKNCLYTPIYLSDLVPNIKITKIFIWDPWEPKTSEKY